MKYEILGEIDGITVAKTNVPMNQSGEAVKELLEDLGGIDYSGLNYCKPCNWYTDPEYSKKGCDKCKKSKDPQDTNKIEEHGSKRPENIGT